MMCGIVTGFNVERLLRTHDEAFMAKVYRDRVEMWLTFSDWQRKQGLAEEIDDEPLL
jgi:hypothetical protein